MELEQEKSEIWIKRGIHQGPVVLMLIMWLMSGMDYMDFFSEDGKFNNLILQIDTLKNDIQRMNAEKSRGEEYLKNRDKLTQEMEKIQVKIRDLKIRIPESLEDTQILTMISNEVDLINMDGEEVKPLKEQPYPGVYVGKSYLIKASGTFLQFLVLMERLFKQQRIVNVNSVKLSPFKMKGLHLKLRGEVVMETFVAKGISDTPKEKPKGG